jgi:hypothetical protein
MVLTALQLADELEHERGAQKALRSQVRQHAQRMLDYIRRLAEAPTKG